MARQDNKAPSETPIPIDTPQLPQLPPAYTLSPTVPSPFTGTLDASLDAILEFGRMHPELLRLTTPLLKDVDRSTNWLQLFKLTFSSVKKAREAIEEVLFLVTRKLLPEQIADNRARLARMYALRRSKISQRVMLRYDMVRERQKGAYTREVSVESRDPKSYLLPAPAPVVNPGYPERPPFLPNVISTLIAAPAGGHGTKSMCEGMKHYVTELDQLLLLTNEEVRRWNGKRLILVVSKAILNWQWVREANEKLDDIEVIGNWAELEGKADENEMVRYLGARGVGNVMMG